MKAIPDDAKRELCRVTGVNEDELTFLGGGRGDSDGIVYKTGCDRTIKMMGFDGEGGQTLDALKERMRFAAHLGDWGVPAARPLPLANGALYAAVTKPDGTYVAYLMPMLPGRCPENADLTPALSRGWGRMTGLAHRATKSFKRVYRPADALSYTSEARFFYGWCRDPEVKARWAAMKSVLDRIPRTVENYGFIHNDNHCHNILADGEHVSLIDFDCASEQFFAQDVLTSMQGLFFEAGGIFGPVSNLNRLTSFLDDFLSGYEVENHLPDEEIARLDLFLSYRRLLLYTCMQDWLDTQAELKAGVRTLIDNPPAPFAGWLRK